MRDKKKKKFDQRNEIYTRNFRLIRFQTSEITKLWHIGQTFALKNRLSEIGTLSFVIALIALLFSHYILQVN